ncbi:ATP-binding protein [Streptomyces acidiscabies]|uniref:ATP-binding protein n=1 Tax=Streptomyces acidiscabies TaxID=42234 RepID=A0ABU4LWQ8_9ACTN|nr:ATP-binding protein [Streptomyces acidiscabies]
MRYPPGVGKTMLSVALGRAAVDAGHRVYFTTTAAELAAKCHRAALEGRWKTCMRFFADPKLLVIDLCRARDYAEKAADKRDRGLRGSCCARHGRRRGGALGLRGSAEAPGVVRGDPCEWLELRTLTRWVAMSGLGVAGLPRGIKSQVWAMQSTDTDIATQRRGR